jgi:hypothetical protein
VELPETPPKEIAEFLMAGAKRVAGTRAAQGIDGFDGSYSLESQAMILSMAKKEHLKNIRFYTKKTSYASMTSFLKSIGVDEENLGKSKEDYIAIHAATDKGNHAVCFLVNLKKIRKVSWDKLDVSGETLIHCFDSSRVGTFSNLSRNIGFLNCNQQEKGSCWFQALAAVLVALENPEVVGRVLNGEIPTHGPSERVHLGADDVPNEFTLKQVLKLQEVVDTLAVKLDGDISLVEGIILNPFKERMAELAGSEKFLAELDRRIGEAFEIFEGKLKNLKGEVPGLGDEEYRKYKKDTAEEYRKKLEEKIKDISAKVVNKKPREKAGLIENLKKFVATGEEMKGQTDNLEGRLGFTLEKFIGMGGEIDSLSLVNMLEDAAKSLEEKMSATAPPLSPFQG